MSTDFNVTRVDDEEPRSEQEQDEAGLSASTLDAMRDAEADRNEAPAGVTMAPEGGIGGILEASDGWQHVVQETGAEVRVTEDGIEAPDASPEVAARLMTVANALLSGYGYEVTGDWRTGLRMQVRQR